MDMDESQLSLPGFHFGVTLLLTHSHKSSQQGNTGFSLCFRLPGFHFGVTLLLTHSHISGPKRLVAWSFGSGFTRVGKWETPNPLPSTPIQS